MTELKIQILVATMFQEDYSLLDRLNVQTDAVVVNQCGREGINSFEYNGHNVLWVDSTERGLSRSRNMALQNASADICVLCDDDERLSDGYPKMIENAYSTLTKADFIAFNINRIGSPITEKLFTKPKRIGRFKTYGSVHITFRRASIIDGNISFNTRFGTGSGEYLCDEDSIFCVSCRKNGLKMYASPGVICDVNCEGSTWFKGFNEKYFYDKGAYLAAAFPCLKFVLKWYYPIRCRKLSELNAVKIISAINKGIRSYKQLSNKDENI